MISEAIQNLARRLPPSWRVTTLGDEESARRSVDAVLELSAPDGTALTCLVEAKSRIEPRDVPSLATQFRSYAGAIPIVISTFLSPRTRERLEAVGLNYLDLAGNIRLVADRPGLFMYERSADRNPWREERPARSLKGAKAGRIVRALCDFLPPLGVRDLAKRAGADPGYVSRTLALLDREDLIRRLPRGPVTSMDWQGLIRRWAQDCSLLEPKRTGSYLEPRGLPIFFGKLAKVDFRYAVTGSFAASKIAPVAPPRLLICYVDDRRRAAEYLDLRPTEVGANVILVQPFDPVVYERSWEREGMTFAALSQVAVDLETSPGRGPAEADALMKWMADNENAWRS